MNTSLVVGLGNPGPRYARTRHNLGAMVLEELLSRHPGARLSVHRKTNTEVYSQGGLILARPRSMMNLSGGPVAGLAQFFRVPPERIVVLHDELDLDFGQVKARPGGGDHGHNGLRSITKALGTKEYVRLSCGIGRPPGRMDPAAFVLKPFSRAEQEHLPILCADAADEVERVLA
ncbi:MULTISPECIES: aminoacyl-tRNA hydrolase [unclassified Corynebacterium]|uniref:aminoacyl-tRNA hydrolase n=1 Tax=unclassified Corynebacterium TaxID=2624378 RepID=UPI0029C9D704|nr:MULTISPECIES: aminoacyl-tRNA hydrolase [unclassified Corynebacterium]WPF66842.1 aminoacyl-tRNA hydrolase [Corynebacterium sp. 22KM0430]WPF69330.1 aminoacyl-tRNA hydrolase [Corynebacterium sp. 21KM1197]